MLGRVIKNIFKKFRETVGFLDFFPDIASMQLHKSTIVKT
jgi:hypothetical protein